MDEITIEELRKLLLYGELLDLRAQLAFPGGRYRVISITSKGIKLQMGKKDPITLSIAQLLSAWTPGSILEYGATDGVLSAFGYRVGRGGLGPHERRLILKRVFSTPLSGLPKVPETREWGGSRTRTRLLKLANCLAAFARNAQRQPNPPQDAVDDWKSDLSWLRQEFDAEVRGIRWPSCDPHGPVYPD